MAAGKLWTINTTGEFRCKTRECQYKSLTKVSPETTGVVFVCTCDHCGDQYVGVTTRALKVRLGELDSKIRKKGTSVFHEHFRLSGHKTYTVDVVERKAGTDQDKNWIKILGTRAPDGLNLKTGRGADDQAGTSRFVIPWRRTPPNQSLESLKRSVRQVLQTTETRPESNRVLAQQVKQMNKKWSKVIKLPPDEDWSLDKALEETEHFLDDMRALVLYSTHHENEE